MPSLVEIAELVGARVPEIAPEILHVSSIELATPVALVFATDAATLAAALRSPAGGILTKRALLENAAVEERGGESGVDRNDARLLAVDDPRYGFALAAKFLATNGKDEDDAARVHPTAVLGAEVRLGKRVSIGPHVVIGDGVTLGDDCEVLANVTVYAGTTIGDRVLVQAGAVLG